MANDQANTIVCRCEDVSLEKILQCIANGYTTINEIKRETRAGMGPCQGRTCRMLIAQHLAKIYGVPVEEVESPAFRPPVKSIPLDILAKAAVEDKK